MRVFLLEGVEGAGDCGSNRASMWQLECLMINRVYHGRGDNQGDREGMHLGQNGHWLRGFGFVIQKTSK